MTSPNASISINALRVQFLHNGRPMNPVFRGARRFHASPTRGGRPAAVNPDSLSDTLENHRAANRPSVARRVKTGRPVPVIPVSEHFENSSSATRNVVLYKNQPSVIRKFEMYPVEFHTSPQARAANRPPTSRQVMNDPVPEFHFARASQKIEKHTWQTSWANPEGLADTTIPYRRIANAADNGERVSQTLEKARGTKIDCPWLDLLGTPNASALSRLNQEIKSFETYMSMIPQEDAAALRAQHEVQEIFAQAGLPLPQLIASRKTGMAFRHSNINLMIPITDPGNPADDLSGRGPSPTRPEASEMQAVHLAKAISALECHHNFSHTRLSSARTPHVLTTHTHTGVKISIGSSATPPTGDDYVLNYVSEFPTLRRLYAVLRMVLETRTAFGMVHSTISGYGLIMMIVASLKLSEGTFDRKRDVGLHLLNFLSFYSEANFRRYGISVEPPGIFRKKDPNWVDAATAPAHIRGQISIGKRSSSIRDSIVCIQDPANYANDLGLAFFQTAGVQSLFRILSHRISAGMLAWEIQNGSAGSNDTHRSRHPLRYLRAMNIIKEAKANRREISILSCAVGGNYDHLEKLRDKAIMGLDA